MRTTFTLAAHTLTLVLALPLAAPAAIIHVPADYPAIQPAIDAAADGDSILVATGTYFENIDFKGKAIVLQGEQGAAVTVLDGSQAGSTVSFVTGEGAASVLRGFTIINGTGTYLGAPFQNTCGGGVLCSAASPTIEQNVIAGNAAEYGAGIFCTQVPSAAITGNTIYGNSAKTGAGILCHYSHPDVTGNVIAGNAASFGGGGLACWLNSAPLVANNLFFGNTAASGGGAGMRVYNQSSPLIINDTFYGNVASGGGGGAVYVKNSFPAIVNTVLWNDSGSDGAEIWVGHSSTPSVLDISYSDVQGSTAGVFVVPPSTVIWGPGMIADDPLFVDPAAGEFHLQQDPPQPGVANPCVDSGDPAAPLIDGTTRTDGAADAGIVDMGYHTAVVPVGPPAVFSVEPSTGPSTGGTAVAIVGEGFTTTADTTVLFDALPALDVIVVDASTITCAAPQHAASVVDVTVTNSNGSGVLPEAYTYELSVIRVPGDFARLQDALAAASDGDTVLVAPGVYLENIDFLGKDVSMRSDYDGDAATEDIAAAVTVIDGGQNGSVVTFAGGEGPGALLRGFTIINGSGAAGSGGGITCRDSSPSIVENVIAGNVTAGSGGGLGCSGDSSPFIAANIIRSNRADAAGNGGGIACGASALVVNNIVTGNVAAGLGGGIHCLSGAPIILNNTVAENEAASGGGISAASAAPVVTNTILWNDAAALGPEIFVGLPAEPASLAISHSDVAGGLAEAAVEEGSTLDWLDGMISADPLFAGAGDRHISWSSPCRDTGDPAAPGLPAADMEGDPRVAVGTVDMGADEFYFHLYHTDPVKPGGPNIVRVTGLPGLPVWLFLGSGIQNPPTPTAHGNIYLKLPALASWPLGTVPAGGVSSLGVTVPKSWLPGQLYPFQALVGPWGGPYTKLTNLMALIVE